MYRPMKGNPDSSIREIFACRIGNPGRFCLPRILGCRLESWIQLKESGIPPTMGVQNPSSADKYWNPVPGIRTPQRVESRLQECPWFPYIGKFIKLRSSFTFTIRNTHDCSKLFAPTKCTSVRTWELHHSGKVKQQTKQTYLPLPHHLFYLKKKMQEATNWELIQYYCWNILSL